MDFDQVLAMTKGHIALGGGGLALFGSGCLYCWPENLSVRSSLKLYIQCDQIFIHKNECVTLTVIQKSEIGSIFIP